MAVAAFHAVAALRRRGSGEAVLQAVRVDVIAERFHVGEALIGMQHALRVACALPAVADLDIDIAQEIEPRLNETFDRLTDRRIVGERTELLPA